MLFNSWEFLCLLGSTFGLYYLPLHGKLGRVWQVTVLLIASAVFYSWNEPKLLLLLASSCLINAISVERILHWKSHSNEQQIIRAKRWLFFAVATNLLLLVFFKYASFLFGLLPGQWLNPSAQSFFKEIPLPIGISFYTFQGISLLVDTWRRDISEETANKLAFRGRKRISSIRDSAFYISFFPQLVAGPIVKAHEFVDQIGSKSWQSIDWVTVRRSLICGYFLKIFIADNLAEQTAVLTLGAETIARSSAINLLALLYGYSMQIFADFAGYSLIAIGLGALFGYKLPTNFNYPYLSTSITEFWRRWHLSLSSWLRDYLYFPLGGNRKGRGRTYFNLFLVMFVGGLWHGAAWKFALWGSLHGIFLAVERMMRANSANEKKCNIVVHLLKWSITFNLVTFMWLTFLMPDMASIEAFFKAMLNGSMSMSGPPLFSLLFYGSAVFVYHAWGWSQEHLVNKASKYSKSALEPTTHALMLFLVITNPGAPKGFIYFQF